MEKYVNTATKKIKVMSSYIVKLVIPLIALIHLSGNLDT
jgi:hypothetical protein